MLKPCPKMEVVVCFFYFKQKIHKKRYARWGLGEGKRRDVHTCTSCQELDAKVNVRPSAGQEAVAACRIGSERE